MTDDRRQMTDDGMIDQAFGYFVNVVHPVHFIGRQIVQAIVGS